MSDTINFPTLRRHLETSVEDGSDTFVGFSAEAATALLDAVEAAYAFWIDQSIEVGDPRGSALNEALCRFDFEGPDRFGHLTPIQRHSLTCPLCQDLHINGVELDKHLSGEHGLDREGRFEIYKQQVATRPMTEDAAS